MRKKYFNIPGHFHYLTFSCYHRQKLLTDPILFQWLAESIDKCRTIESLRVNAYVFMPEHVHLLIQPVKAEYSMSRIMRRIKEPFSRRVVAHWETTSPSKLAEISAKFGRRYVHRFWQAGGGFDRNLYNLDKIISVIQYIEFNPVRRGIVSDPAAWEWSSAQAREGNVDVPLRIDKLLIE